ncbi:hypothetical protein [Chroococcidiopsis sp. CCNUC1]|uniref:hypothetical protein n=1 Tax=Chroococcidiopsis sp. CCNUC1 TaxID=2653189 RepID=UPI002020578A|nr:hypothetical protein [Chroococcidiopsis sp. CCNUC1]URD52261.1 hypothetical protein M5J74_09760 [Chroococcidiopsis sp. CCNUC1]
MRRLVLKVIQIFLAIIIFWVAAGFGSALFYAFTSPYPSCSIRQYFPCSLQLGYFFYTFVLFLIFNPFAWFQPSLKYLPLTLSGIACGTISVIYFFKIAKFIPHQLNLANASPNNRRQTNRKRQYLTFIAIATTLLAGMVSLQFKLTTNSNSASNLPKELGNVQVLTSIVQPGLMEGCYLSIFELEPSVSHKIQEIGITYFDSDAKLRANISLKNKDKNPYSQWKYTPVPEDSYSGALSCGETDEKLIDRIWRGMESAGGYYIMTKNKEGVIVVLPNENLAAELYYG